MTREPDSPPTSKGKPARPLRPTEPAPLPSRALLLRAGAIGAVPVLLLVGFLLGRVGQDAAAPGVLPADILASLRQDVLDLRTKPQPASPDASLQPIRRELELVRAELVQARQQVRELAARPGATDPSPELEKMRQELQRLGKTADALALEVQRLRPAPQQPIVQKLQPEVMDVLVLALHSENLGLNHYLAPFRELFADQERLALHPDYRLGLALVEGGKGPDLIHPFTERERKQTFRVYPAPSGTTDRLDTLGAGARALFKEPERTRRHCLIVASVRCVPVPPARFKDWDGLCVSVILIGPERYVNDLTSEQWKGWHEFCGHLRGRLAVLAERSAAPDEQVQSRLRDYLRDWSQPIYPTGRK